MLNELGLEWYAMILRLEFDLGLPYVLLEMYGVMKLVYVGNV